MRTPKEAQSGFTLIEVMVALTIFAIGLLAIANMQIVAIMGNNTANVRTTSSFVGQGVLEDIQSLSDSDPLFSTDRARANWGNPITLTGSGQYTVELEIDVNDPVDGVARVRIWVDGPGGEFDLTGFKRISI